MIRICILLFLSTLFASLNDTTPKSPVSTIIIADSIYVPLFVKSDEYGIPDLYYAKVVTPVCEVDKCYYIELDIYWDLIGRFHHFDTIPGNELTKLDHKPFEQQDYRKLIEILDNPGSPLANYSKEELVKNTRSSDIDGFTGATIQEIKENVIEGAVYSCYTLWHIVYSSVIDSIENTTRSFLSHELVHKLVKREDQKINYYLINNFTDEDFKVYLDELLTTNEDGKGYYTKNLIEKLPNQLINESHTQEYFAGIYMYLNYFSKVALLKKLERQTLSNSLKVSILGDLDERSSLKNDLIKDLLKE